MKTVYSENTQKVPIGNEGQSVDFITLYTPAENSEMEFPLHGFVKGGERIPALIQTKENGAFCGTGINVKICGTAAVLPDVVIENQVVLFTDIKPDRIVAAATSPECNSAFPEGSVWLPIHGVQKEPYTVINLSSPMQRSGSTLKALPAYIGKMGRWKYINNAYEENVLYHLGYENDLSGGFVAAHGSGPWQAAQVSKQADHFEAFATGDANNGRLGGYRTKSLIDMPRYRFVYADIEVYDRPSSSSDIKFGSAMLQCGYPTKIADAHKISVGREIIKLDVSNVSTPEYIFFAAHANWVFGTSRVGTRLYSMWLE